MDSCPVLHKKADTKYRFLKGTRKIQPADASYLYANRDKKKFSHWIANRTEECDSYDAVAGWLHDNGIKILALMTLVLIYLKNHLVAYGRLNSN